jgi:Domain of unknown function (DUF1707)
MEAGPDLRIGDAEREAAAAHLREHFAQGRLSQEEFTERLDAVFAAKTRSQLGAISSDLPQTSAPSAPLPVAAASDTGRERAREDDRSGRRARLGFFPVVIAALAAWFLIVDTSLRTFPWPGKLAIFLAILAMVRGLLRRLGLGGIGGGRGGRGPKCGGPRRRGRSRGSWDI